jgi:glutamate racemase
MSDDTTALNTRPIAVFDSGLGGLTVARAIVSLLPRENLVYFGDTARVPYGNKSERTIRRYAVEDVNFMLRFEPKLVVVACNTVSSIAMEHLAQTFRVPLCGVVEPGARAAASATKTKKVAIIGTEATIASGSYQRAIQSIDAGIQLASRATPLLVPIVEEGRDCSDEVVQIALKQYLTPFKSLGVDAIVLGCTHYPLLKDAVRKEMGDGVTVVDSAEETASEVKRFLSEKDLLCKTPSFPQYQFFVSDSSQRFLAIGRRFFGADLLNVREISPDEFFFAK